jgi:hypothetical protein
VAFKSESEKSPDGCVAHAPTYKNLRGNQTIVALINRSPIIFRITQTLEVLEIFDDSYYDRLRQLIASDSEVDYDRLALALRTEEGGCVQRRSRRDPHRIFYLIKLYAVEVAATIVFLAWLLRALWHEIRFP